MQSQHMSALGAFISFLPVLSVFAAIPDIPQLNWTERSDWVNVMTDVSPGAAGDGVTDDADAIQAALDLVDGNGGNATNPKVVYLPAGTYRITKTLVFPNSVGLMVIGHGRDTRIEWDGPADSAMAWSDGATSASYIGLSWYGNGVAGSGIYHRSIQRFECKVLHEHEAFRSFRFAGIRTSDRPDWEQGDTRVRYATSETMVRNCLFDSTLHCVAILYFNYYNWLVEGCEFRNSTEHGIFTVDYGQVYVNACHFENTLGADIALNWSHSHSIRNCTSKGSNMFIWGQDLTVENCAVDAWTSNAQESPIALSSNRGPFLVFDCSFTNPPNALPRVKLDGSSQQCAWSNLVSEATPTTVDVGNGGSATEIPQGNRSGSMLDPAQSFLIQEVSVPGRIFDVKEFGAAGDGSTNDADAIQEAIDSAAAYGNNCIVYFPASAYMVSRPINISGSNFTVGGTGYHSEVYWNGPSSGSVFEVRDADSVTLDHLNFPGHRIAETVSAIRHEGGGGGTVTYDWIWGPVEAMTTAATGNRGLVISNLSSSETVRIGRLCMSLRATNCGEGVIVGDFVDGYPVMADGPQRTSGFFGVNVVNGGLIVRNNHDFVAGNVYMEESGGWGNTGPAYNGCMVEGGAADPAGRVTIGAARGHVIDTDSILRIHSFTGIVFFGQGNLGSSDAPAEQPASNGYTIASVGTQPATLVFMANYLDDNKQADQAKINLNGASELIGIENKYLTNAIPAGGLDSAAKSLDHFAELSRNYLALHWGIGQVGTNSADRPTVRGAVRDHAPEFSLRAGHLLRIEMRGTVRVEAYGLDGRLLSVAKVETPAAIDMNREMPAGCRIVRIADLEGESELLRAISIH